MFHLARRNGIVDLEDTKRISDVLARSHLGKKEISHTINQVNARENSLLILSLERDLVSLKVSFFSFFCGRARD